MDYNTTTPSTNPNPSEKKSMTDHATAAFSRLTGLFTTPEESVKLGGKKTKRKKSMKNKKFVKKSNKSKKSKKCTKCTKNRKCLKCRKTKRKY